MQIHTKDSYQKLDETKLSKKLIENEPFIVHFDAIRILFQNLNEIQLFSVLSSILPKGLYQRLG